MNRKQQAIVYDILKRIVTTPTTPLESDVPFLNGLPVRQPVFDLTNDQMTELADILNELAPSGEHWKTKRPSDA